MTEHGQPEPSTITTNEKLSNDSANLRDSKPDNPTASCRDCRFLTQPDVCKIVEGPVAADLLCDWIQSRGSLKEPQYFIETDDWLAFVEGMKRRQPYQHIVLGGAIVDDEEMVLIRDTAKPPNYFSLSKPFHLEHTGFEHHWTQDFADGLVKTGINGSSELGSHPDDAENTAMEAVMAKDFPIVMRDEYPTWDKDPVVGEDGRARRFAQGDADEFDLSMPSQQERFKSFFAVWDPDNRDVLSSYKFPYVDVVDGQRTIVEVAVLAAGARAQQTDNDDARRTLGPVYDRLDRTPPWADNTGLEDHPTEMVWQVLWAGGKGVVYFMNEEDARLWAANSEIEDKKGFELVSIKRVPRPDGVRVNKESIPGFSGLTSCTVCPVSGEHMHSALAESMAQDRRWTIHAHVVGRRVHLDLEFEDGHSSSIKWVMELSDELSRTPTTPDDAQGLVMSELSDEIRARMSEPIPMTRMVRTWEEGGFSFLHRNNESFVPLDEGVFNAGAAKFWFQEWFMHSMKQPESALQAIPGLMNGTFMARETEGTQGFPITGREECIWMFGRKTSPPYALTRTSINEMFNPAMGISALPLRIEQIIPSELRYWEMPDDEFRFKTRIELIDAIERGDVVISEPFEKPSELLSGSTALSSPLGIGNADWHWEGEEIVIENVLLLSHGVWKGKFNDRGRHFSSDVIKDSPIESLEGMPLAIAHQVEFTKPGLFYPFSVGTDITALSQDDLELKPESIHGRIEQPRFDEKEGGIVGNVRLISQEAINGFMTGKFKGVSTNMTHLTNRTRMTLAKILRFFEVSLVPSPACKVCIFANPIPG